MSVELDEKQISVHQLEVGMFVVKLDRPWEETNFLLQGFLITSQQEIDELIEQCSYVFIQSKTQIQRKSSKSSVPTIDRRKEKKGLFARARKKLTSSKTIPQAQVSGDTQKAPQHKVTYINKIPVEKEFHTARESYKYAKLTAKSIMDGIRLGRTLDMNQCRVVVNSLVDSILRNSNALVWLSKLKNKDEYTAEHSLNVCILSVAFARHLGFEEEEIRKIGLCGLLHDVGKAKIPDEILMKEGRFTNEEYELMKGHCKFGRDLLMTMSEIDFVAIDVAYCHHERPDQQGYPRGLLPHQIPYYALIIGITDAYDAITSNRCYDSGRSSMDALDIIYKNRGRQFDEDLALEFIKCIGVYPPGSVVELSNGEVGIVIATNPGVKLRPRVILVLDAYKKRKREKVINLALFPTDETGEVYSIANELPNGKHGVDIRDYLKRGLVLE
jgi:HD-GYP domain-containing protein (c-di-GMP phosphodiesterase class II)